MEIFKIAQYLKLNVVETVSDVKGFRANKTSELCLFDWYQEIIKIHCLHQNVESSVKVSTISQSFHLQHQPNTGKTLELYKREFRISGFLRSEVLN